MAVETCEREVPWRLIAAALLCLATTVVSIVLVRVQIVIAQANEFSNNLSVLYVTGMTVLATLITLFVTDRLRHAWLRSIDNSLEENAGRINQLTISRINELSKAWRSNLTLITTKERFTDISLWPNQLMYLVAALITTAIVAATTPSISRSYQDYTASIPSGNDTFYAGFVSENYDPKTAAYLFWNTSDDRPYYADVFLFETAAQTALRALAGINQLTPHTYAYQVDGVAVHGTAAGVPESIFTDNIASPGTTLLLNTPLSGAMAAHGDSLLGVSHCGPVLSSNPVRCRTGGSVAVDTPFLNVTSDNGACNVSSFTTVNMSVRGAMASQACPTGDTVGSGQAVIGATNWYSSHLALMMGDVEWMKKNYNPENMTNVNYAVTCDIDVASSVTWRQLNLDLQAPYNSHMVFRQYLTGGEDCVTNRIGPGYAATAFTGIFGVLKENAGTDGWLNGVIWNALNQSMHGPGPGVDFSYGDLRSRGWAFNESRNGLEDVLGLSAALGMTKIPVANPDRASDPSLPSMPPVETVNVQGTKSVQIVRVGTGHVVSYICAIPPLLTLCAAVWLLAVVPWTKPTYKTTDMQDLIEFGARAGSADLGKRGNAWLE